MASGYLVMTSIMVRRYLLTADEGGKDPNTSVITRVNVGYMAGTCITRATGITWIDLPPPGTYGTS